MRLLCSAALWLLVMGCIPKNKYDAALADRDGVQMELEAAQAAQRDLQNEIAVREGRIGTLEQDLTATRNGLDELSRQLANKVAEAGELQTSVAEMELALSELEQRRAEAELARQSYRDLVRRFQAMIDAGTLRVKVIDGRLVVELATDILFPPGGAALSKEGKAAIADVAEVLASIPDRDYQVAGHTDDDPIATAQFPSNWHLGAARAIAVTRLLVDSGLSTARVSAASFAEHRPVAPNRTKDGKAMNRRIEIAIVPDLSMMPGYEELEQLGSEASGR